jgi:hypothetical protein
MHAKKWVLLTIILLGGTAVLGSYVYGILNHPGSTGILWGGVPDSMQPLYTVNMLLATIGFFIFTGFILFYLPPSATRIGRRFGYDIFILFYVLILIPSALWMPITYLTVEQSNPGLLWLVRLILATVGIGSIGLLLALWKVEPRKPLLLHRAALIGAIFFCIQTVLLDAIVWTFTFQL